MIDANSKTNSFLEAIEKYAEEQKIAMRAEIEAFREEQLKHANEEGTAAAFSFIQKKKAEFKTALAKENSLKETAVKRALFEKRNKMAESVFEEAAEKLREFSKSKKYEAYINNSAKSISEYLGGKRSVVYISENDEKFIPQLKKYFGSSEIAVDSSIKLGGIRCFCEEMSIIADETLDSKFEDRKRIFIETSGFTVE